MYKFLLCLRYLRTRYLAFVCIVSVMLGVATLIVVNSVMSGFSTKLKDHLHGILSDVLIDSENANGFGELPQIMMKRLAASPAGADIEAMAPTVEVFALLQFTVRDRYGRPMPVTRDIRLIGVDPEKQSQVGQFSEYLVRQKNQPKPSFSLTAEALDRFQRNRLAEQLDDPIPPVELPPAAIVPPPQAVGDPPVVLPPPTIAPSAPPRLPGIILGYSTTHIRDKDRETGQPKEYEILKPGDDVTVVTYTNGPNGLKPVSGTFVITDFFQSEMSEYDGKFVYVSIDELQRLRGMDGRCSTLQVRLKPDVRNNGPHIHNMTVPELAHQFPPGEARVESWQQKQGSLLTAIDIERGILNLLLFLIVGVSGFSVLAIFTMIVAEKYRDIGILKSLGASDRGIMGIFLAYGLLLGLIGCVLGTAAGLTITANINEIEAFLTKLTGQQIFDRSVYYFTAIPTNVEPLSVLLVNVGAVGTAVLFSVLPAMRAARLHPVRALRFE